MPKYPDVDYLEFMRRVTQANPHFERLRDSSLHGLIVQLRHATCSPSRVRVLVNQVPADKQRKYQAALSYLAAYHSPHAAPHPAVPATPASRPRGGVAIPIPPRGVVAGLRPVARPAPVGPAAAVTRLDTDQPQVGYALIVDPDPVNPIGTPLPPLTRAEVVRINEAVARMKRAIQAAIDGMTGAMPNQLYTRLFGAYDEGRRRQVLANFQSLAAVVQGTGHGGGLYLIDARNDQEKYQWFAATVRGSATANTANVWIGRSFFSGRGDYEVSSDATVVTMVHELAHACFSASDVPVAGSGHVLDASGMPPHGVDVANDLAEDERLAQADPALAVRNADNYGQFAWLLLQSKRA